MKFIDKIRILEQDPKFQESRRKLKAMRYIASKNPSADLSLSKGGVLVDHDDDFRHRVAIEGWVLNLTFFKPGYSCETLSMIPLSEHKLQEV